MFGIPISNHIVKSSFHTFSRCLTSNIIKNWNLAYSLSLLKTPNKNTRHPLLTEIFSLPRRKFPSKILSLGRNSKYETKLAGKLCTAL